MDGRVRRGVYSTSCPRTRRGATRLLELLSERSREEGALFASLFSEIGSPFYERIGFQSVPQDEVTVTVTSTGRVVLPRCSCAAGEERDFAAVAALDATTIVWRPLRPPPGAVA